MPRKVANEPARGSRAAKIPDRSSVAKIEHETLNEQRLIAAAIVDAPSRSRLVKALPADGFYGKGHAAAWAAIVELERRGLQYDPATVAQISNGAADAAYLDTLARSYPAPPANIGFHVEVFLWDRRRVEAARGPLASLVEALQDPASEPEKIRALARTLDKAFAGSGALRYLRDPNAVTMSARARIEQRRARFAAGFVCYPYGIPGLDLRPDGSPRLVPGMAPQQMTLVAAESGNGKTCVTNQIVLAQANAGVRVLHGAWEQDGETNLQMLAGYSLGLPRTRLWTGDLSEEEVADLSAEMDRLGGGDRPLVRFFELPFERRRAERDRRPRSLNDEHLDVIHEHVEASGCTVAVFDLLAKAIVETKPEDEKRALDRLLGIAVETNAHLIALHHLNKGDAERRASGPTREAIKGGTHWIDAFDTVLGLRIPSVTKDIPKDTLEIRVLKQRYGEWPLAVEFAYDAATGIISGGKDVPFEQVGGDARGGDFVGDFLAGGPPPEREPKRTGSRRSR